jgi:hypothetical protein
VRSKERGGAFEEEEGVVRGGGRRERGGSCFASRAPFKAARAVSGTTNRPGRWSVDYATRLARAPPQERVGRAEQRARRFGKRQNCLLSRTRRRKRGEGGTHLFVTEGYVESVEREVLALVLVVCV